MSDMVPAVPADDTRRIALVDLLDRVLGGGVVITGEITLSLADVARAGRTGRPDR